MTSHDHLDKACGIVRKLWERHGVQKPFRFLGFCLSLTSLPVLSQVGQALEKHLEIKENKEELDEIWESIRQIRSEVDTVANLEDAIKEIALAINSNQNLLEVSAKYIEKLTKNKVEVVVLTETGSLQEFIRSAIKADIFTIDTSGRSRTVVSDTTISADKTVLKASGDSQNRFVDTRIVGKQGMVGLDNVSIGGHVEITGTSVNTYARGPGGGAVQAGQVLGMIGFGPGGAFMGAPHCPQCNGPLFSHSNGLVCKKCNRFF